jgi:hypothetical protein
MVKKACCVLLSLLIVVSSIQLTPASSQTKYKANEKDQIDVAQVRTVVTNLGVGRKVSVRLDSGVRFNGMVMEVSSGTVTIRQSEKALPNVVAFDQIREFGQYKSKAGVKALVVIGVILGAPLLYWLITEGGLPNN